MVSTGPRMLSRVQLNIILTHFCLARKLPLPGRWGGARNRPLESAEKIAKAEDEGLVEIEREEVKRKGSDEYDEPPAKNESWRGGLNEDWGRG